MTQAGLLQVIPGGGGRLGQVISAHALPGSGPRTAKDDLAASPGFANSRQPAILTLRPLGDTPPPSPATPHGASGMGADAAHDIPANAGNAGTATARAANAAGFASPATASPQTGQPPPGYPPGHHAAALVTIIQQVPASQITGTGADHQNNNTGTARNAPDGAPDAATPGTSSATSTPGMVDGMAANAPDSGAASGSATAQSTTAQSTTAPSGISNSQTRPALGNPALLTPREQDIVRDLRARDANVRSEEESHQALAGANAGLISYRYTAGPDGRLYATDGSVSLLPLQGLKGIAAIANQAAISRAASVPGSSPADFSAARGASRNIGTLLANQAIAAAESYRYAIGLGLGPGMGIGVGQPRPAIDISG